MVNRTIDVIVWRRGRGLLDWKFTYLTDDQFGSRKAPSWYTSPGWYHFARKYVYRLTVDHDYPNKPLWLGRKFGRRWVNMEGLYEPLIAHLPKCNIVSSDYERTRRSTTRVDVSRDVIG